MTFFQLTPPSAPLPPRLLIHLCQRLNPASSDAEQDSWPGTRPWHLSGWKWAWPPPEFPDPRSPYLDKCDVLMGKEKKQEKPPECWTHFCFLAWIMHPPSFSSACLPACFSSTLFCLRLLISCSHCAAAAASTFLVICQVGKREQKDVEREEEGKSHIFPNFCLTEGYINRGACCA